MFGEITKNQIKRILRPDGGFVDKMIDNSSSNFFGFGELYRSKVNYLDVRGWKFHTRMYSNIFVMKGSFKFVYFKDDSDNFESIEIDEDENCFLSMKPKIWFAFQGLSDKGNILLNFSSIKHSSNEVINKDINSFDYNWANK